MEYIKKLHSLLPVMVLNFHKDHTQQIMSLCLMQLLLTSFSIYDIKYMR